MHANSAKQTVYAINAQTGEQIWAFKVLAEGEASAASRGLTYWEEGKQYIALSVGGTEENPAGSIMAFSLP